MKLNVLFLFTVAVLFLTTPAFAKKPNHGNKNAHKHSQQQVYKTKHKHKHKNKRKRLPPGLQKKVERGQALPPGWQRKVARGQVLDVRVYRYGQVIVPIDKYGAVSILVDNKVIRLIHATREILDVFNYR